MLEKRLYNIMLLGAFSLSILSIIMNTIGDLPWSANIKWVTFLLVTISCFIINKSTQNTEKTKLFFFLFIIVIFAPFSFFYSGGSVDNALGYSCLLIICIVFLFDGTKRNLLVILQLIVHTVLHIFEHQYPQLIKVYSEKSNFIERITQIPIIMLAIFLITSRFANAYLEQKSKQEKDNLRLEKLANYDTVTNLYNRRAFNRALNSFYNSFPDSTDVFIAIIDLDYFKHINDQLGHLTGDEVLQEFAYELKIMTKNPNVVCRWGGDEFALLFNGDKQALEKTLKKMQKSYNKVTSELKIQTSISIGVALWKDGVSVEDIMKKADMKLYEVKSNGGGYYLIGDI